MGEHGRMQSAKASHHERSSAIRSHQTIIAALMALDRCTASVTPARTDEKFIADADNVGIYQGYV
jgi:hypothetical protein